MPADFLKVSSHFRVPDPRMQRGSAPCQGPRGVYRAWLARRYSQAPTGVAPHPASRFPEGIRNTSGPQERARTQSEHASEIVAASQGQGKAWLHRLAERASGAVMTHLTAYPRMIPGKPAMAAARSAIGLPLP